MGTGSYGTAVGGSTCVYITGAGLSTAGYSCGQYLMSAGILGTKAAPVIPCVALAGYGCYQCYQQSPSKGYAPECGFHSLSWDPEEMADGYLENVKHIYGCDINFIAANRRMYKLTQQRDWEEIMYGMRRRRLPPNDGF